MEKKFKILKVNGLNENHREMIVAENISEEYVYKISRLLNDEEEEIYGVDCQYYYMEKEMK